MSLIKNLENRAASQKELYSDFWLRCIVRARLSTKASMNSASGISSFWAISSKVLSLGSFLPVSQGDQLAYATAVLSSSSLYVAPRNFSLFKGGFRPLILQRVMLSDNNVILFNNKIITQAEKHPCDRVPICNTFESPMERGVVQICS